MSQHILEVKINGQPLHVQMGWDSPMKWFYLVISPICDDGELDDPVYSNLNEADPGSKDLDYYLGICSKMNISIPSDMISGILEDQNTGAMNRKIEYSCAVNKGNE